MHIAVKNATKSIKGTIVLDNITLEMSSGTIYGLRGPNGAGKTMLLRLLCGLIVPTSGDVFVDGIALGTELSFPKSVGVLIENPGFINSYTGLKNLRVLASIRNTVPETAIKELMQLLNLNPERDKRVRAYSLGMKQKLGIISALMEEPELILLDEPINALDEESAEKVLLLLTEHKRRGALIVVASHDRQELDFLADTIIEMRRGRISDDSRIGCIDEE